MIYQKQAVESNETWQAWEMESKSAAEGWAECESQRAELLESIEQAFVPVTHNIRVEAIE